MRSVAVHRKEAKRISSLLWLLLPGSVLCTSVSSVTLSVAVHQQEAITAGFRAGFRAANRAKPIDD